MYFRTFFLVGKSFSLVDKLNYLVGKLLSLFGKLLSPVGKLLSLVGKLLSLVGKLLSLVGKSFSLAGKLYCNDITLYCWVWCKIHFFTEFDQNKKSFPSPLYHLRKVFRWLGNSSSFSLTFSTSTTFFFAMPSSTPFARKLSEEPNSAFKSAMKVLLCKNRYRNHNQLNILDYFIYYGERMARQSFLAKNVPSKIHSGDFQQYEKLYFVNLANLSLCTAKRQKK